MTTCRRWRARGMTACIGLVFGVAGLAHGSIPEDPGPLWVARYDGPASSLDTPSALAVSPDGSKVFVTGGSSGSGSGRDYATSAYSASSGAELWTARYEGPGTGPDKHDDVARSVAVSPDGSKVFVTGYSWGSDGYPDYATVAYSAADGTQLWVARYIGPGKYGDYASSVVVSPDGSKVFVTGSSYGSGLIDSNSDYATVAYSAADGTHLWVARYNGPANSDDYGGRLAVSPDGSKVFVAGSSNGSDLALDFATVAYSATGGAQLWVVRYNGQNNYPDTAASVAVSRDGSKVFVTGSTYALGRGATDYATVAYSAISGAQLWMTLYNGTANNSDHAHSLATSPDGSKVFVTGDSRGPLSASPGTLHTFDYATVAYSTANGARLWVARYDALASDTYDDVAASVAVSPDGSRVVVTGYSDGTNSDSDYATVAYSSANGAQLWVARYDGPGKAHDLASSVAVSPDASTVFVTGWSDGSSAAYAADYATLAYRATSCDNGRDEGGPVSGPVHERVEPLSRPLAPYVHGVSCDVLAANRL